MNIYFHKNFERQYKKLNNKQKTRFKERIAIFLQDKFNPILNNHSLRGKYKGYRSINVAGDLRAIYKRTIKNNIIFIAIDNHNNLYN